MTREQDIAQAIRKRNVDYIVKLIFEKDSPRVRQGFRTETNLWDFKSDCPRSGRSHENAWADLAKEILGFHNSRGGLLIFGVNDDFEFVGATTRLDSKMFMDRLRKYIGDRIWVDFHRCFIQADQRYLGIALVPPRGESLARFQIDAPTVNGKKIFQEGWSAIREGDSTKVLDRAQCERFSRELAVPLLGQVYSIDEPYFRILNPDYRRFVERPHLSERLEKAMQDSRSAVAAALGIGGVGKTALATWSVLRAYERGDYPFIVSVTAKDRELTTSGILPLESNLSSFENLLDSILEVLGFPDEKNRTIPQKESSVRTLLDGSNGLLYVDNLETVDDPKIIDFLDDLPKGVNALVTSRRPRVRVSVHPVDVAPLSDGDEVSKFIRSLQDRRGFSYINDLSDADCVQLGRFCSGIPLAVLWVLGRSSSASEALHFGEAITDTSRTGEELLEFCFRRIFNELPGHDRAIMEVLSIFQKPISQEALIVGTGLPAYQVADCVEELLIDSLVGRLFDPDQNDYCYALLPITRAFVYSDLRGDPSKEEKIRSTLTSWYEATDVRDPSERLVVREIRQGSRSSEEALLDLAVAAERREDCQSAEKLYEQATARNPQSWRAARLYGEFLRHKRQNKTGALMMYERAARYAPRHGPDRALIFREYGMILRDAGTPESTDLAIECFQEALSERPADHFAAHALAHMLSRKGQWDRVIEVLEPLKTHHNAVTREKVAALLIPAYEAVGEILKLAELRRNLSK